MNRSFILISLLFSAAVYSAERPTLAVLISFDCPYCKSLYVQKKQLFKECGVRLDKPRCDVKFLPFVNTLSDIRAQAYFAAREEGEQIKLGELFYSFSIGSESSLESIKELASSYIPAKNWDKIFSLRMMDKQLVSVQKTARLITKLGIIDYPSFIWFDRENNARLVPVSIDPKNRLQEAINWVRKQK